MVKYPLSLEDLTFEEQMAVTQLKKRMMGYIDPDLYEDLGLFVRFARARDLNVNAAEAMLKKHLQWRKMMQIDTISDYTPKEVTQKYIVFNYIGQDKEGSPILYFDLGGVDARGVLKSCKKSEVMKDIFQRLEKAVVIMRNQSIKLGKNIDKWSVILNFENLAFAVASHKPSLDAAATLITMYEGNYPERLKIAYVINASVYFTIGFAVVKHLISGPTFRKLRFFGKDGWKEDLLKDIDAEVLPAFLGGHRTDPDGNPRCTSIIPVGGTVPERYFIKKKDSIASLPGVEKLIVTRMSKARITVNVTVPGSYIEWEFETKSRDIGFSLLYRKNNCDPRIIDVIPKQRIDTYMSAETGMYKCDKAGVYIIEFDNSYSWIFQKEIYYRVTVKNHLLIES